MLTIPEGGDNTATIVGIDPGTDTLGFSVIRFDLTTLEILSTEARTLEGSRLSKSNIWLSELHGDRASRIYYLQTELESLFNAYQPLDIVAESPFFQRKFPQAYGALLEVVSAIRYAVMRYDGWKELILVDPPSVKVAVGAEVQGGKGAVRDAILAIADQLHFTGPVGLHLLDEHSIDAIAIALWRFYVIRQWVKEIPVRTPQPKVKGPRKIRTLKVRKKKRMRK